jgi:peptide/nickel transport system substrate-binding protein
VSVINDGGGTNPITENEVLIWNIFDALLQQDITGALHPGLASTYDVSSDGLTYTFQLRHNAKWTDGNAVDSNDVVFTYNKVLDPDVKAIQAQYFTGVLTGVKALDQWTVQFKLAHRYSQIVEYFAQQRIAPVRLFGNLTDQQINTQYTQSAPITDGPFKVKTVVPGQVVKVVRNDQYYFPRGSNNYRTVPYVDELDYYPFGDPQANVISMQNSTRDVYALTMTLPEYQQISKFRNVGTTVHPVGIYNYLWLNDQSPLFNDARVRQAMTYAIDRGTIVKQLLSPIATVMTSLIDPSSSAYDSSLPQYSYDPAKAKQLLAAAGWTPGSDGILTKGGQRFSFTTLVTTATFGVQVIEPMQQYLKAVGIEMKVRGISGTSVTQAELIADEQSPNFVSAETNDGYEVYPDRRHRWLSSLTPPAGNNFARYQNPALDSLLNDSEVQPEGSAAQKSDYTKIQQILWRDLPVVPMYYPLMVQAVNTRVCGTEKGSVYILQTASKWWVNKAG